MFLVAAVWSRRSGIVPDLLLTVVCTADLIILYVNVPVYPRGFEVILAIALSNFTNAHNVDCDNAAFYGSAIPVLQFHCRFRLLGLYVNFIEYPLHMSERWRLCRVKNYKHHTDSKENGLIHKWVTAKLLL